MRMFICPLEEMEIWHIEGKIKRFIDEHRENRYVQQLVIAVELQTSDHQSSC